MKTITTILLLSFCLSGYGQTSKLTLSNGDYYTGTIKGFYPTKILFKYDKEYLLFERSEITAFDFGEHKRTEIPFAPNKRLIKGSNMIIGSLVLGLLGGVISATAGALVNQKAYYGMAGVSVISFGLFIGGITQYKKAGIELTAIRK